MDDDDGDKDDDRSRNDRKSSRCEANKSSAKCEKSTLTHRSDELKFVECDTRDSNKKKKRQ